MTDLAELEARVARLEARHAIAALVTAYAAACDEHDMTRLMSLFTEDAVFDSASGLMAASGPAEIEAMFIELFKVRGPAFHWTHDHLITIDPDHPRRATGRIYAHAETSPGGVVSLAAMRYDDAYRDDADGWRFARRTISFLYYVPAIEFPASLISPNRLVAGDRRYPADYPETLESWRDFERRHLRAAE